MDEKQPAPRPGDSKDEDTVAALDKPPGAEVENREGRAAPGESAVDLLRIGPVVLAISSAVELMIWLWRAFPERHIDKSQLARYTSLVVPMFQADNDRPIYLGGAALTVILAVVVYWLWRPPHPYVGAEAGRAARRPFWVAAAVVLLPIVRIDWIELNLAAAILGFAALVRLYVRPQWGLTQSASEGAGEGAGEGTAPTPRWRFGLVSRTIPPVWPWGGGLWLALALVIGLLYVPRAEFVSGFNYQLDGYVHWNSYAMFPALAYRNGGALITEHYVEYGVGWPLVLAGLAHFTPLSYGLAIRMGVVWGCAYYVILFCFLQSLLRRTSWAFAGLALALVLQCFGGMVGSHKWALPSGTVLRYSVDMLFFLTCLYHARSGRAWLGAAAGGLVGCALLFGTDTGVYLTVCLLFYLAAVTRLRSRVVGPRGAVAFSACATAAYVAIVAAGLWTASRGGIFQAKFWSQWLEAIVEYGGGISDLPIADAMDNWRSYAILALVLISYLVAVLWMLERLWFRKAAAEDLITGLVALYGMATLLLFVGRSDPPYLRNVSIPYCVVLTRLLFVAYPPIVEKLVALFMPEWRAAVRRALEGAPWLATAVLLLTLPCSAFFLDYPGWLSTLAGNRWTGRTASEEDYLFASRHDAPLEKKRRSEVRDFRAVRATIRGLSAGGRRTVAMLGMDDTEYLVEADIRPYFRYSPVLQNMLTKDQVRVVERTLIETPPDYVLYPAESPDTLFHIKADDVYLDLRKVIRDHFVLQKRVAGSEVYRRKTTPDR